MFKYVLVKSGVFFFLGILMCVDIYKVVMSKVKVKLFIY